MSTLPGAVWGTVHTPSAVAPLGDHGPHDQGRTQDDEHVAVVVGSGDQLLAQRVDRAPAERSATGGGDGAHRVGTDDDARQRGHVVQPRAVGHPGSQPWKSNSGSVVMATVVSMAPTPLSAALATAWAGQ